MLALIVGAIGALLGLAAAGLGAARRPFAAATIFGGAAVVSAGLALLAASRLVLAPASAVETLSLPIGLPGLHTTLSLDALSAFFLLVVNLPASAIGLFAIGYGAHEHAHGHGADPGRVLPLYPLFVAAMDAVLIAGDAYAFVLAWELMSLASWALVLANHREPDTAHAAWLYLMVAGLGTLCLIGAFGLAAQHAGGYDFAALRAVGLTPLAVALALIGTGSKAGLMPLHAWLPPAHAAAPTPVSALMSGVMTKVALYGLIRLTLDLAGPLPWGWGAALTLAGGASAVLGLLFALLQTDIKRLLAYSTVENLGIAALGIGLALMFRATGQPALATLALTAGLLHALNHALFKSLLFCAAGAITAITGTRDLERLGGLIARAPRLALATLAGAIAIAGLPPFNGFVSEWLTFQAIVSSPRLPQAMLRLGVPLVGALLALAAALAAVCFVRLFGIVFLGRPRSAEAAAAPPPAPLMTAPLLGLGALCLLLGVLPVLGFALIDPVVGTLGLPAFLADGADWLTVGLGSAAAGGRATAYSGLALGLTALALGIIVALVLGRASPAAGRRGAPWDCGFPEPSPATQYTASSFSQPLRRIFGPVFQEHERVDMPAPLETRAASFAVSVRDPLWTMLYQPPARLVEALATRLNVVQFLTIRRYLSLTFAALVILMLVVVLGA
jgi:formate hydrogenlyase subunit 3/multisubunit Na+/H+ antiporter MnhD subunit